MGQIAFSGLLESPFDGAESRLRFVQSNLAEMTAFCSDFHSKYEASNS